MVTESICSVCHRPKKECRERLWALMAKRKGKGWHRG